MNAIYESTDYRELFEKSSMHQKVPYRSLAHNAGIHTSYFSRVMTGKASFSAEQLYQISKALSYAPEDVEYVQLLGEMDRSGNPDHRRFVKAHIEKLREEKLKLGNKLQTVKTRFNATTENIAIYYQEATTAKIHMYLTVEKYRHSPSLIAKKLGISETKLRAELKKLEDLKIIAFEIAALSQQHHSSSNSSPARASSNPTTPLRVRVLTDTVHLEETHPSTTQNLVNWRLDATQKLGLRDGRPSDYHMSVAFSCDEGTKIKIKEMFKEFVVKAQQAVGSSTITDDVYAINFDLY